MSESFTVSGTLTVRTFAKGLFSALAHDLELRATSLSGTATRTGEAWSATLELKVEGLRVAGVLRRGKLHQDVLSAGDRADIERKIREDVFAPATVIRAIVEGTKDSPKVRFEFTSGRSGNTSPRCRVRFESDTSVHVSTVVSMKSLGLTEVKGPLGAFSLKDEVEVEVDVVLAPSAAG